MLTHERIWAAIDQLAERYGLSVSGLALKSGLAYSTLNPSRRRYRGRPTWPSTETIARALNGTGASLRDFLRLIDPDVGRTKTIIPVITLTEASHGRAFSADGQPASGWDEMILPANDNLFALRVDTDDLEPLYRAGDVLVLSTIAPMRKGDRVVARTKAGEIILKHLAGRTARAVVLGAQWMDEHPRPIAASEIAWIARVMWIRV